MLYIITFVLLYIVVHVCTPNVSEHTMEPGTPIECKVFLNMSSIFTSSCGIKEYTLIVKPLKYECPALDDDPTTVTMTDDSTDSTGTEICEIKESRRKIKHRFSVNNQC